MSTAEASNTILLVGASRGLGLAMAAEFLKRGWDVTGTVRGAAKTGLHELAGQYEGRVAIETLDIADPDQIAALRQRLSGRRFDMLFVNAGVAGNGQSETVGDVSTDDFIQVMVTNTLGPMRVIEQLQDLVSAGGLIGVMSSGQGSLGNNSKGGHEVYRSSKAALNMAMRSYAARRAADARPLVLMAPGWIRTGVGGPDAPFGVDETIPQVVDVLIAQQGKPGLHYLDRDGNSIPW